MGWRIGPLAAVGLAALALAGCMGTGDSKKEENPAYSVVAAEKEFEVRQYGPQILAQYSERGLYNQSVETGYIKLERYFLGENWVPVAIPLTVPVMVREDGAGGWTTMFVLPPTYRIASTPEPKDTRIRVAEVPARRVAAVKFGGKLNEAVMREQTEVLGDWLAANGIRHRGDFTLASYDPPWTPASWRENEVMVTLE